MKKKIWLIAVIGLVIMVLPACGIKERRSMITVISREDGSGTRGAFVELFDIQKKNDTGDTIDLTTVEAEITNSTAVMLTSIAKNKNAIGYVSLGSFNGTVKAVKIDGAEVSMENIKSGTYKIARPFNIVTTEHVDEVTADFIHFIKSEQGQKIVEDNHYISKNSEGRYKAAHLSGKIVIAGSSSVSPVMEKIKEAYILLNPGVTIEVQQSDSTTGVTAVIEGLGDIGMASRELTDSELNAGLIPTVIALDGIAIVINHENPRDTLSAQEVKDIFTGTTTTWSNIQ